MVAVIAGIAKEVYDQVDIRAGLGETYSKMVWDIYILSGASSDRGDVGSDHCEASVAAVHYHFFRMERVKKAISRLGEGLSIGLDNDRVIFKAFRKHAINGESEAQEKKMDEYFRKQTKKGFSAND